MAGERIARELGLTTFQLWCAVGAAFAVGVMTNARSIASTLSLSLIGAAFLYPAPKPETFQGFFKSWFLDKYMPVAGKLYRDKLKRQSRNQDAISAIGTSIARFFHKATEDLNNTLVYEMTVKHALPKKVRRDVGNLLRIWHVNLGSVNQPVWYTFLGVFSCWMWVPIVWTSSGPALDMTAAAREGGGMADWVEVQETK